MNSRIRIGATAILFPILSRPAPAASLISNGEFTKSIAHWEQIGTVFDTGEVAVLSDAASLRTVVFQTAVVPEGAILLRLSFDLLTGLSSVAGIGQTPDSVFISAFLGTQPFGTNLETAVFDTAIPILDADYRGVANPAPALTSAPSPKGAGWTRYFLPLSPAPFATVDFEFIDGNGVSGDSTSAVDNVRLDVEFIPEPEPFLLLLAAGVVAVRRRRSG